MELDTDISSEPKLSKPSDVAASSTSWSSGPDLERITDVVTWGGSAPSKVIKINASASRESKEVEVIGALMTGDIDSDMDSLLGESETYKEMA
jgi:hypothetical protein